MKSHIFATTLLGSVGIASAAEYPSMVMDTWCITYLSTYLAPISGQPSLSPSRHLTFFGNSSTATVSNTDEQSIIASEPGTTPDFSSFNVAPTEAQTGSGAPSSGSITEPIITPSVSTTDITSSALPTSTGIVEPPGRSVIFLIQASNDQKRDIGKREAEGFVGADNPDICTFALVFNLAEGQLFVGGLPTFYAGEDYKALGVQDEDSFIQGAITRTFGTTGRTLFFRNSDLPNGEAGFCQDSSGQVYITFTSSPPGCFPVTLGVYDVTQCQNGRLVGFETSTSALAVSSEASTTENVSSGSVSSGESTTAETTVSTEFSSLSSVEPSSTLSETSDSEAFTTASSQIVDTSAPASSQVSVSGASSTVSSQIVDSSTSASAQSTSSESSTVSSQAISSSASTSGLEAPTTVSSELVPSSVTTQSSIFSSDSTTEASSSTELEISSSLTSTSEGSTGTTTATSVGSTTETPTEPASSASSSTFSSAEETTSNPSTTISESSTEITSTTTEASTADTTTDLMTTTTTAALSECRSDSNPHTESGVDFDLSCDNSITSGTSIGVVQANSFNQCVFFCAQSSNCAAIQYEKATMLCSGFSSFTGTSGNAQFDVAVKQVATTTTTTA
ncbi:hypothetical protein NOF04DRAFT_5883 [Fusarium oxysporum II5]|uniref:Apple domain-containing protein n=1 Tax=Fusarium odoratissimum (strain NRRL 54006) TaxID=1089451 RepID=X0JSM9_FUSO5|nr:uncharacterized protein FOIG_09162 [Fusarium odoratissimum NRRL 54006]EXL99300.1 hypothetical protein FOIG_09162 [Fusarium odoratissimum NRRL 54006]KAK2130514.1 hypothetical protein NOF04DRAFT_5883 [Fusarium oxysporum II5]